MYTEGYIKRIECIDQTFEIESAPPYCLKSDGVTYTLGIRDGPIFEKETMNAIVTKSEQLKLSFCCCHLSAIVTLKATHGRVGVYYDNDKNITELVVL